MKANFKKYFLIALSILCFHSISAIDNHFYRSSYFWGEPRFEKPWLTSLDFSIGGANTRTGRNSDGNKTPLLNILGPHNMQQLGSNVPGIDPANPLDQILINLENLPSRENFGHLEFTGRFRMVEARFNAYQNLVNGFFLQTYLPLRKLSITEIQCTDLSPDDTIEPNKNTPEWQAFLTNFSAIMQRWKLSLSGANRFGVGDVVVFAGWARNYEDTCVFDFIDVDAKIGILFPTGQKRNSNQPFDLPLGHNGFYGTPLCFNCSIGALDWLTVGFHSEALFFFERTQKLRLKTNIEQNGFIKLACGDVEIDQGTIWQVGLYTKADHFYKGLSLLFAYAFTRKDEDCLEPKDSAPFKSAIINADQQFNGWNTHVLNFLIEYDFAKKSSDIAPVIGLMYNRIVSGKRVFDANIAAAHIGFNIAWCF